MKKYLMTGIAALAMGGMFTSCTQDMSIYSGELADYAKQTYEQKFIERFGKPDRNQTWGFGSSTVAGARGTTRAISVNGDSYDKFPSTSDIARNFPTAIPENADEVSQLETLYKGTTVKDQWGNDQTLWGLYQIYAYKIVEGYNLKITQAGTVELGGTYQNAGWDNARGKNVIYPYNVYVDVDGDVTIRRAGSTHFNLYILRGNVTLEDNYGEQAGLISVAAGATLNDYRNSIAANQGISLFNRGTVNAKNAEKYDIGNFSKVYNEGKFNVTGALTYSPGDANDSYFMNLGDDAELTAPSMTLNSAGNFFNDGKVTIAGETSVTQARIYWVNAGHYTTGSMTFSAKNATFYNYCQLIVTGNAHMYDGEFNLMNNSYTEAATAEFDNFIVNMCDNSGFNVKGNTKWEAQGDGTYQGFRTTNGATKAYVRLGGTTTVAGHLHTLELTGNITYAINNIVDLGAGNSGVQPTYVFNAGTTEAPFEELTVTPKENECGAKWTIRKKIRVIAEDLSVNSATNEKSDFDFNDIVFDVFYDEDNGTVSIKPLAAGGELQIYIGSDDNAWELHHLFMEAYPTDPNVTANSYKINTVGNHYQYDCPEKVLPGTWWSGSKIEDIAYSIMIRVRKNNVLNVLTAEKGKVASKIAVGTDYEWCDERQDIDDKFSYTDSDGNKKGKFSEYVGGAYEWNTWYK